MGMDWPPEGATPADLGWLCWHDVGAALNAGDGGRLVPPAGGCSVHGCGEPGVAAIRRSGGARRPTFWQAYCRQHARERGVVVRDGAVEWATSAPWISLVTPEQVTAEPARDPDGDKAIS